MSRPALPTWGKIAGAGIPAIGGGSWLITLAGVPRTAAIIVGAALLTVTPVATAIAVGLPRIAESVAKIVELTQKHKATNLRAKCEVVAAESEARISRNWTRTYNKIAKAGMSSPEKAERAERLLQTLVLSRAAPCREHGSVRCPWMAVKGSRRGGATS